MRSFRIRKGDSCLAFTWSRSHHHATDQSYHLQKTTSLFCSALWLNTITIHDIFIKYSYFFERPILGIRFYKGSLLISPLQFQSYIPCSSVSVFVTVRMAWFYFLKGAILILTGETGVIYCFSNSFSSRYYNYFLEYSQPSILSTVLCIFLMLKFAAIQFGQSTFFQHISEHQSPLLSKQLCFQSSIDYN